MAQLNTLRIGGVPEHFNLPWHQAIEKGLFSNQDLDIQWQDYPGGTGAMTRDLRSGLLDIAVLLTEGIIADICKGNPSQIIAPFVVSPLIWGIHVPANSNFQQVEELAEKRFAISRHGSGSHLMAFIHARQHGWNPYALKLVLVGDLSGAREAFYKGEADGFMWEKTMTQPLVDKGEFRRIGECPTPWPCFVIAARNEVITTDSQILYRMLNVIAQASQDLKADQDTAQLIATRYGINIQDVFGWLAHTQWAKRRDKALSENRLQEVMQTLADIQVIDAPVDVNTLYKPL